MKTNPLDTVREAAPLVRAHMPTDYRVSLAAYTGRGKPHQKRIPDDFGPMQPMRGFESTYRNIVDYIVRITHRIWEERDVEYISATYDPASHVYDDYGLQRGNRKIIADTHHTTGAFSDIQLLADEIVWAGNDEIGYHTSHRTIIRGTNDGPSRHGPATGKSVDVLVIANCVALDNQIFLEHVLYNNSSMLRQLGYSRDPGTWQALQSAARPPCPISIAEPVNGFDVDRFVRDAFSRLWNNRDLDVLTRAYATGFSFRGPTDRAFIGTGPYPHMLRELFAAFPDLHAQVDEVYWMGNEGEGFLTSERWSAEATHTGAGLYGEPTGKRVQIWGITQHQIVGGRIVAEWLLFNELDVMMQIAAD
jgi:predicted ester cyclase